MGWFIPSPQKSIKPKDLDKALDDIPSLDRAEREYVKGVFSNYRYGNITKRDVERALDEMRRDTDDIIDPAEVAVIKKRLKELL